ncbi:protein halfway [Cylas formicarius]|uniref:protein halfway n=1 Tax=Cylas formicarius TaxID=197179 RepID=UPI0029587544|nr:protein halfway [Cylas formicarius]
MMQVVRFVAAIFLIVPTLCVLPDDDNSCHHICFHQPQEACPPLNHTCRCQQLPNCRRAAICCNVNKFTLNEGLACGNIGSDGQVEALHIRNATLEVLNLSQPVWRRLKRLRYMTISDGQIGEVAGEFARHASVSCLNLSSNSISKFEERSLVNLYNLSFLDLSNNNLSAIPRFRMEGNVTLDVSDNGQMACSNLKSALRPEVSFVNENQTFCETSKDFEWFQSTEKLPLSQVIADHELQKNCYHNCTCKTYRLNLVPGKLPSFEVEMNCSGKQFQFLPVPLPDNTISLDVSGNNITSIKELSEPSYQNLRHFYADNNQISSIQPLEGTKFIGNFDTLSLRNNKIKMLETYLLDNIQFERNFNQRKVNLGMNSLVCDCNTMKLKVWLLSKLSHIPDHDQIQCENMNSKVTELDASKLCQSPQDWTDYIYYIITGEVLLLVSLIAKVSYDYWVFKTAGYLPWPASKMPRLPCDWLCE